MTFLSYAQNFEDVLLWRALQHVPAGFYIDAGAADPDRDSVTRAFYDRGWHGINLEPVPELHRRLQAARPRDINLDIALGQQAGTAELFVVDGGGLSTLHPELLTQDGEAARPIAVEVMTLAQVCRCHAPPDIHFLKVDVEGSEHAVLAGADFMAHRPWIVLVEATAPLSECQTYAEWEPLLLAQEYRFAFFDGLNRFYVAAERQDDLLSHLQTPANVFDDFLRVADTEWARRIAEAETRAGQLQSQAARLEAQVAREIALRDQLRQEAAAAAAQHALALRKAEARTVAIRSRMAGKLATARGELMTTEAKLEVAQSWLGAMRGSTSWRVTAPLRRIGSLRRDAAPDPGGPAAIHELASPEFEDPDAVPPPARAIAVGRAGPHRAVHQFHSGSAVGDAITNAMLLMRGVLRSLGFESEIYVQFRDPKLACELRTLDELPTHPDYALIVRHSMGYDALARITALPASKILLYHNITPPELLNRMPVLKQYARVGRDQLDQLRPHVIAALADSEYNAIELRRLGYDAVWACPLLFDLAALQTRAARRPPTRGGGVFTVLFVGRVMEAKAQDALIAAFACFRRHDARPSRLVLVGRVDPEGDPYRSTIESLIDRHGLHDHVTITGLVSDDELDGWYGAGDLYVSLSRHEGFGVPLVEAMAFGMPVLAWPCGAVPYTLDGAAELLADRDPDAAGAQMAALAGNPARCAALVRRQQASLARFHVGQQIPTLLKALALAGAVPPDQTPARDALASNMRFTVVGHVNRTYSLAAINRSLALTLEAERPGSVRLMPVETQPTTDLSHVPAEISDSIRRLAARPPHETGPELVISQHYPVYVPSHAGDLCVALFFWEESLVPAETVAVLNAGFHGVLAPSSFVARALLDSGLHIPVRQITHVPAIARRLPAQLAPAARPVRVASTRHPFSFLHVSSCFPRKGVDVLLAAYALAFRRGDPVRLVIKGFANPHNTVAADLAALRARDPGIADIELIDAEMSEADLLDLYAAADAAVLPTRGEGLNLPAAEALAAGLPLIVTGCGGHMDFCDDSNARLISYRLAASASHLASPHSLWAEPDLSDLAAALREAADRPLAALRRSERAAPLLRRLTDPATSVRSITNAALDLLLTPPAAPARIVWISTWQVRCGIAEYSRHMLDALTLAAPAPSAQIGRLAILCDTRTPPQAAFAEGFAFRPCWLLGLGDGVEPLTTAISAEDPDIVVLQHHPGLMLWDRLSELLRAPALQGRVVAVALHNTTHLIDSDPHQRDIALAALATAARVLVHTVTDVNALGDLGLRHNVTLMPHGVALPQTADLELQPRAREANDHAPGPVIGCYGFFLPDKGVPQLIQAIGLLRVRWPGIRLRLVNAEYPSPVSVQEIAYCRAIAAELEVDVEWMTAFLDDQTSLDQLAGCDLVALPYQRSKEASSAAVRTALMAGIPVIVTPLPLFDEAADAVMRLAGMDSQSIADGIASLLDDPGRQSRITGAARRWLSDRGWSAIANRLFGMLLGLRRTALCDATRTPQRTGEAPSQTVEPPALFEALARSQELSHEPGPGAGDLSRHEDPHFARGGSVSTAAMP